MNPGLNAYQKSLEKRFKEFDIKTDLSRKISRSAIYRLIILSAGIVAFSVSLFSVKSIQSSLDIQSMRISWYFFMGTIILGFFILFFEGRVRYGKTWKGFQETKFPKKYRSFTFKERVCASLITILTLLYPANLIFNRIYEKETEKRFKSRVNGLVVHKLAGIEHDLIFLENLLLLLFICGLVSLIISVSK